MTQACILTDNTAQFPAASFPGLDLISIIPIHVRLGDRLYRSGQGLAVDSLPVSAINGNTPTLQPPTTEEFQRTFLGLGKRYGDVVTILTSSHFSSLVSNAIEAAASVRGTVNVYVIDSQTTGVGLGLLVQAAAKAASEGSPGVAIKRLVLGFIPHIYAVFYITGLTYLTHSFMIDSAQAIVGELLGMMPLFGVEGGGLVPIQKARSSRHLVDSLHEFVCEFDHLNHVALLQGVPPFEAEVRSLRERIQEVYPNVTLTEHHIGPILATMFGPHSLGVFVMEKR